MKRTRRGANVVVVSDLHCGCRLALCPPRVRLDDGGEYVSSKLQGVLWSWWNEFWYKWVPQATHGEPFSVVVNGDALEGVHHRATTQISQNLSDQTNIAFEVLEPITKLKKFAGLYIIRGTEAHVGPSGAEEERLARRLGAIPNAERQYARYELWKRVGNGLVHFMHHIGVTSSSAHETSAVNAELAASFYEAGRWGHEPPDIVVRSHRHRCVEVRVPARKGYASSLVTAAWQLKTPFMYRVAGARITTPQIGGSIIRQGDEELHTRHWVRDIERSAVE